MDDIASSIARGPDLDEFAESVKSHWEAGFADVALVQVGEVVQQEFLDKAAGSLVEKRCILARNDPARGERPPRR